MSKLAQRERAGCQKRWVSLFAGGGMQKFNVSAWPIDSPKREYNPEWEIMISADLTGEAYARGEQLFHAHCAEHRLDSEDFIVHAGIP